MFLLHNLCHLHLLFNAFLCHSYLPNEFLYGTISPIIKDSNGDTSDSNNYRGITLGPILAQVFEGHSRTKPLVGGSIRELKRDGWLAH